MLPVFLTGFKNLVHEDGSGDCLWASTADTHTAWSKARVHSHQAAMNKPPVVKWGRYWPTMCPKLCKERLHETVNRGVGMLSDCKLSLRVVMRGSNKEQPNHCCSASLREMKNSVPRSNKIQMGTLKDETVSYIRARVTSVALWVAIGTQILKLQKTINKGDNEPVSLAGREGSYDVHNFGVLGEVGLNYIGHDVRNRIVFPYVAILAVGDYVAGQLVVMLEVETFSKMS